VARLTRRTGQLPELGNLGAHRQRGLRGERLELVQMIDQFRFGGPAREVELQHLQGAHGWFASHAETDERAGNDGRFGRVVEQRWVNTNTSSNTDDFQYTYDQDGNALTRSNGLNSTLNEQYGYDSLNRLTSFSRGSTTTESWSLDALGNWLSVTTNGSTQTRSANAQNQVTAISGATTPAYDNNGNTLQDDQNHSYVYDAWNRIVKVTAGSNTETFAYDALGRRIRTTINSNPATDLYYSAAWQVVEEDVGGSMSAQYVWSPVYVDAMVERDTSSGQRLYVQQDANWNVTALVDTSGNVQERYAYDPYGKASVLDPSWNARTSSLFSWLYLYQGGRYDSTSGLYNFRNRDLSPTLGRWLEQDPVRYAAGGNLYEVEGSEPTILTDAMGLFDWKFYFWEAPKAAGSGLLEGLGNEIVGGANAVTEIGKFGYDIGRTGVQAVSLGTNAAFGTGVYQFELSSSVLQGMNAASQQGQGGQYVLNAMANGATLGGLQLAESGIDAVKTGDSTQFSQNAGGFAVNVALTIAATKALFPSKACKGGLLANAARYGIDLEKLTPTDTVAAEIPTRPYINSPNTILNIIESGPPRPDPGGVPGALRWDAPGWFNGRQGTFELVIDPASNRILHFLFRGG
jgi:RHS repeat-associated protein